MAERYSKLYSLPAMLYASGAPVLISAGALLKDSQTGNVLCQLKFRNISGRNISALKVRVHCCDVSGELVCRAEHQYLDLKVASEQSFGSKEAIPLPDSSVRSYSAQVLSVHFSDGSRWAADEDTQWEPLPGQEQLRDRIFDRELLRQYRLETSSKSEFVPLRHKDIWLCSCGTICPEGEDCAKCGGDYHKLMELLNVELLLEKKNQRLLEESKAAAKRESSRAHSMKVVKIVLLILIPVLLIAGAAFFFYIRSQQRAADYELANLMYQSGQYAEAAAAYDALGDYADAPAKANAARDILSEMSNYDKAKKFLENGRYDDARETFLSMGDYGDAPELALEADYLKAMSLVEKGELENAQALFTELGEYKDAAVQAQCFKMLLTKEECSWNAECEGPLTVSYEYNEAGQVVKKTQHFSAYEGLYDRVYEYEWNGDGSHTLTVGKTVQEYDAWGILLRENGEAKYEYDYGYYDSGAIKYYGAYALDGTGFVFEQVYDEKGNPVSYNTADGLSYATKNEYDDEGRLVKQENFDAENKLIDRTGYEYDEEGRLKRSTYMDLNNVTSVTNYSYELKYVPEG